MDQRPIGVFDSGCGGLTVIKAMQEWLPNESFVYFGDLANLPYGEKTHEEIVGFSRRIARFLMTQDVKMIIIACGTATSHALDVLQEELSIPVVGVVGPGASGAYNASVSKKIGILGTNATVKSRKYDELLANIDPGCIVVSQGCPKFVELAENENATEEEILNQAREYLVPMIMGDVDTIVLGCTHFPILENEIQRLVGPYVTLVNPSLEAVKYVSDYLTQNELCAGRTGNAGESARETFYVSANPEHLKRMARRVLGKDITVKEIHLDE